MRGAFWIGLTILLLAGIATDHSKEVTQWIDHMRGGVECAPGKHLTCSMLPTVLTPTSAPAYDLFRLADNTPAPECKGYLRSDGVCVKELAPPQIKWTNDPAPSPILTLTRGDMPYLSIFGKDGAQLVVIDMKTGRANLTPGKSNEAARQFWKAIEANFPVCKKKQ